MNSDPESKPPVDDHRRLAEPDTPQFNQWFIAARTGSDSALWKMLDAYRAYVTGVVRRSLGTRVNRKVGYSDVVQETVIAAKHAFPNYRGESKETFRAWLTGVANQVILNVLRGLKAQKRDFRREVPALSDDVIKAIAASQSDGRSSPARNVISTERARMVAQAIGRLPEDYQRVIQLRIFERQTFAEISQRMDRSEDAARQLYGRAIIRLERDLPSDEQF